MPSFSLLCKVEEWAGNLRIVWDKVAVIACETQELADFGWVSWGFPLSYTVQLAGVHAHLVLPNNYAQVFNLFFCKLALGRFEIEIIVLKLL
jgi:hypothetical protein